MKIRYLDIPLIVEGSYIKGELEETYHRDDLTGYPGSADDFEIEYVMCNNQDITDLLSEEHLLNIKNIVLKK